MLGSLFHTSGRVLDGSRRWGYGRAQSGDGRGQWLCFTPPLSQGLVSITIVSYLFTFTATTTHSILHKAFLHMVPFITNIITITITIVLPLQ